METKLKKLKDYWGYIVAFIGILTVLGGMAQKLYFDDLYVRLDAFEEHMKETKSIIKEVHTRIDNLKPENTDYETTKVSLKARVSTLEKTLDKHDRLIENYIYKK